MIKNTEIKSAICILGMHRSGTSAITRGFNLLGAYLGAGEDLMPPLPENPEGFWERMDIYYLQENILSVLGRDWTTSTPLPENWHASDEMRPYRDELVKLVKTNFSGHSLWAWKDPRTCLLLPLWREVLSDLGIGIKVVFVVRNPLDVARSLEKRNGFPLSKGLGMWFAYTLVALKGVDGLETIFVSYDRFLANWKTELTKCAKALGVEWPVDESVLKEKMAAFIRQELRHSVSGLHELHAINAPDPLIRLYGLLLDLQAGVMEVNDARSLTESMYRDFRGYFTLFESVLTER